MTAKTFFLSPIFVIGLQDMNQCLVSKLRFIVVIDKDFSQNEILFFSQLNCFRELQSMSKEARINVIAVSVNDV